LDLVTLATDLLQYINAAVALVLAAAALAQARRGGRPGRWGAAAFAMLAVVLVVSAAAGDRAADWVMRVLVCVLLPFPFLLLGFTASFGAVSARFVRMAAIATAAMLVVSLVVPSFPAQGEPRPAWYIAYVVAVLAFWTALSLGTIVGLWRRGAGQPTLARRRARLMSVATAGMNLLILVAGVGASEGLGALAAGILMTLSLAAFSVGFAPPGIVRLAWRQPEQEALRHATEHLAVAATVPDVTGTLLPHVARIVGGSGAALSDQDGTVVASFGTPDGAESVEIPLTPPFGALVVSTSALTPFFGREELSLLHSLAALADISLARCMLGERELESQAALRLAKDEAERANAAKSDFLSRMSHELRTPLNVVLGFGQILEMRGSLTGRDGEAVEQILKAGRHLLDLINEVLDLSTIEAGRMTISPEPVEIIDLLGEAVDLIRPLADERFVGLRADLAECPHVVADRQRLKQVVLNLLSNAVKYNRDGGDVVVSCEMAAEDRLRVLVRDTGPGIAEPLMEKLFEPFERLGAEHDGVEGTGLGLALSRQLMELMGGAIGVESDGTAGSVFWIELAVADRPGEAHVNVPAADDDAAAANSENALPRNGRRLLLIEDNLANLQVIESVLSSKTHFELLPAMTGRLGLELAREHRPDLILLDQHLPDVTGAVVLQRLKADPELRGIPVVIVSADATPGQVRRMLDRGASDYLTKPLDVPNFVEVVDRLLGEAA
jgi:signal transduction histidine kinase/CheY-like chemotaxis protein